MSARQVYCAHNVPFDRICSMCNPPRCVTCKQWERTGDDGVCHRFGESTVPVRVQVDLPDIYGNGEPGYLVTVPDFGCTEWAAQEDQT